MGHSSIQVTVDIYGHLIPGADIAWMDRLDSATRPPKSATYAQPSGSREEDEVKQVIEKNGAPGETRTPDLRIRSPALYPTELQAQNPPISPHYPGRGPFCHPPFAEFLDFLL